MRVIAFDPKKEPEEEADLKAEIEDRATIRVDRAGISDQLSIAAVHEVDIQTNKHCADKIPDREYKMKSESRSIQSMGYIVTVGKRGYEL
jgi:hypothetical protein